MTFRYFFPFAFDFCPRRALPEVEGDVEDGLGPIINSLTAEDNDVTPFAAKSKDSGEDGEMQSARLQLQSTDDLQKTMQEALELVRSELEVVAKVWESQRMFGLQDISAKQSLHRRLKELFSSWNWSDLEDDTHIPSLEAILEDTDAQEFLNHATTEAAQELMKSTVSCRERLRQRSELLSCLQGPVDVSKVKVILKNGGLRGRPLLEYKLRRFYGLPMTISEHVLEIESFRESQEGLGHRPSSRSGPRTIPSALSD
ncbi:Uncharacterized protein SCF082_LOCUS43446 [Durusdinium trenchii]|uniref:Uncharacterized protein n=1 Tax=Durusdinium trenchii TaxID=1381693 RepID=A0ABP0QY44_9DINO